MRRARLLVMAIAIVAAGAAAWLAWGMMGRAPKQVVKNNVDTVEVLVAKSAIQLGDSVKASDFNWQVWPKDAAKEGYITKTAKPNATADMAGSIARAAFLPGEPIKQTKLIKANEGGVMAAILPAGMRAVATKISEESAAGNFVMPNDHVDVLVTHKQRSNNGRGDQQTSETLFRNIRVLAIGQELDQKDGKKVTAGKTATLELTARQAEVLALNNSIGEVSLSLRSLADTLKAKNSAPTEDDVPKPDKTAGIKVLRYGTWSRSYGLQ